MTGSHVRIRPFAGPRISLGVRLFGPGERVAFLPYSRDMFESTQRWIHERDMFETAPACDYDAAMTGR
jgi:hypothetical protein